MEAERGRFIRREHLSERERTQVADRFGGVLGLLVLTVFFSIAAPNEPWARLVTTFVLCGTTAVAMWASGAATKVVRAGFAVAVVGIGVAVLATATGGRLGPGAIAVTSLILVVLTMGAIGRRIRVHAEISAMTVVAALCVYVLLGLAFAFTYETIGRTGSDPFFAGGVSGARSDFVYFSYITLATVGYGDLTAASDLGRAFAVTEGLMGQIYLVTAVAALVGNIGRTRRSGRLLDISVDEDTEPDAPDG